MYPLHIHRDERVRQPANAKREREAQDKFTGLAEAEMLKYFSSMRKAAWRRGVVEYGVIRS